MDKDDKKLMKKEGPKKFIKTEKADIKEAKKAEKPKGKKK
jgi:hypothetical protein